MAATMKEQGQGARRVATATPSRTMIGYLHGHQRYLGCLMNNTASASDVFPVQQCCFYHQASALSALLVIDTHNKP